MLQAQLETMTGQRTKKDARQPLCDEEIVLIPRGWTVAVEYITPEIARDWLNQLPTGARKLRPGHVRWLAELMKTDQFVLSPEAICISKTGKVINGQHRLAAIVDSELGQHMLVWRGLPDSLYKRLDQGAKRSYGDLLGVDTRVIQPMTYLARFLGGSFTTTPDEVEAVYRAYGAAGHALIEACPTTRKGVSAASVRAAIIFHVTEGTLEIEDACGMYAKLVNIELRELPESVCSLFKQISEGKIVPGQGNIELFIRAYRAFDPKRFHIGKVIIRDSEADIRKIRAQIRKRIRDAADD